MITCGRVSYNKLGEQTAAIDRTNTVNLLISAKQPEAQTSRLVCATKPIEFCAKVLSRLSFTQYFVRKMGSSCSDLLKNLQTWMEMRRIGQKQFNELERQCLV